LRVIKTAEAHSSSVWEPLKEETSMIGFRKLVAMGLLVSGLALTAVTALPAGAAEDTAPLFVNLTTDNPFRAKMAITFSKALHERGHPLTIFLNDQGIFLVSKRNAEKFPEQQKLLTDLIAGGTLVIACPQCLKQFDIPESDLLAGVKVGSPSLTGGALFKEGTQTLSW